MNENIDFEKIVKTINEELSQLENTTVKCAIIGRSGVGKSSLINAISGQEIAEVGEIETTHEIGEPYKNGRLWFYDLPGSSTEKFPRSTYVETMNIKDMDCVILTTSDRFYEDDLFLIQEIHKINIPIYLVRTKIDFSIDRGMKRGISENETVKTIKENLSTSIKNYPVKEIYLTSADFPQKFDLDKLINDIYSDLDDIKKKRLLIDIAITSKKTLEKKRKIAEDIVKKYSFLSAANGLNPIIGADVAVDLSVIYKMSDTISKIFGLTKENIEYFESLNNQNLKLTIAKATQYLLKYVGKDAVMTLLKKAAASLSKKSLSKFVPILGQLVSAGLGYWMVSSIGNEMIDNAESIAYELFDEISKI